jgi:mitotic spindle assembly checkpoint protein MAD1
MDELYKKLSEVMEENTRLRHEIVDLRSALEAKKQEVNFLKCTGGTEVETVSCLETENRRLKGVDEKENLLDERCGGDEEKLKRLMRNIRDYVTGLLGYKIDFTGNEIACRSLYAFNMEDVFVFRDQNGEMQLVMNDFARAYEREIQTYLTRGKSIPAFLAAVTLDLSSKNTF